MADYISDISVKSIDRALARHRERYLALFAGAKRASFNSSSDSRTAASSSAPVGLGSSQGKMTSDKGSKPPHPGYKSDVKLVQAALPDSPAITDGFIEQRKAYPKVFFFFWRKPFGPVGRRGTYVKFLRLNVADLFQTFCEPNGLVMAHEIDIHSAKSGSAAYEQNDFPYRFRRVLH